MTELDTDIVLSAIRRGEDSLPKLRAATGLDYAKLHPVLHILEFEWKSINSKETADGFQRFTPASSEKSNGGFKSPSRKEEAATSAPITPQAFRNTKASISATDATLLQRDAPYCATCRGLCLFDGLDLEKRPRWRCKTCGFTFEGSSGQVVEMAHIDPHKEAEAKIATMTERGRVPQHEDPGPVEEAVNDDKEQPPQSMSSPKGKTKFGININAEIRRIVGSLPVGTETDTPRLRAALFAAYPELESRDEQRMLSTYISQAVSPLRGKMLEKVSTGRGGEPDVLRRMAETGENIANPITNNGTNRVTESKQPERAQLVNADISEDKIGVSNPANKISTIPTSEPLPVSSPSKMEQKHAMAKEQDIIPEKYQPQDDLISGDVAALRRTADIMGWIKPADEAQDTQMVTRQTEIHGSLVLREEVQLKVEEIAQWPPDRITEFFDAISKVVNIPKRTFPTTIKRAWSKSFEDDNEEGMPALTMLYLISMLHEGMEEHEKQAVWCLVLYCKRVQAAAEAAREAKKGEQG